MLVPKYNVKTLFKEERRGLTPGLPAENNERAHLSVPEIVAKRLQSIGADKKIGAKLS